jgi:hypothetical protein
LNIFELGQGLESGKINKISNMENLYYRLKNAKNAKKTPRRGMYIVW